MLFSIYVFALVLGAVLLGASILMGDGDDGAGDVADGDLDLDADGDAAHHEHSHGHAGGEGSLSALAGSWRSLRFWTFFCAFFGAAGALLDGLGLVPSPVVALIVAIVLGLVIGQGAVWVFHLVGRDEVGSVPSEADYIGKTARVLLGFGPGEKGKIRLELRGTSVDLLAVTTDERRFASNDEALIIAMEGTQAVVSRAVVAESEAPPS